MSELKKQHSRSLRFSFCDGIFASGMIGFTQDFFTPFLLLLGGGAGLVGLLSSIPNLISAFLQFKTADLSETIGSRNKFITTFASSHRFGFFGEDGFAGRSKPSHFYCPGYFVYFFGKFCDARLG